jgi:3-oxoacyl-(acyl-carrier-protein) synthase
VEHQGRCSQDLLRKESLAAPLLILAYIPSCEQAVKLDDVRVGISTNLGFGGHNGVAIFKKLD